jgi:hypothetical protein
VLINVERYILDEFKNSNILRLIKVFDYILEKCLLQYIIFPFYTKWIYKIIVIYYKDYKHFILQIFLKYN